MSQTAAGKVVELSPQSIGRIEDGQSTRVSSLHINALCDAYGSDDTERQILLGLAQEMREASRSGGKWWRAYADEIPTGFDHYVSLEASANKFTSFQMTLLPGVLQTTDYRRAGEWTMHPQASSSDVERRVEMAAKRQQRLHDPDFWVHVYLSEAVLRHQVGGRAVMARQLRYLLDVGELPNVSTRVIPHSVGSYVGLHVGSFVLLEFPTLPATRLVEPPVVYVEGFTGDLYLERDGEVAQYQNALAGLDRVALDGDKTMSLVAQIAREHEA